MRPEPVDLVHVSIPILVGAVVSVLALGVVYMWAVYLARALI
jgi:hypothetical protein